MRARRSQYLLLSVCKEHTSHSSYLQNKIKTRKCTNIVKTQKCTILSSPSVIVHSLIAQQTKRCWYNAKKRKVNVVSNNVSYSLDLYITFASRNFCLHGLEVGNCEAVHEGSSVVRVEEEADRVEGVECCRLLGSSVAVHITSDLKTSVKKLNFVTLRCLHLRRWRKHTSAVVFAGSRAAARILFTVYLNQLNSLTLGTDV